MQQQIADWLAALERALGAPEAAKWEALFAPRSYWRDFVALTWNIATFEGPRAIGAMLASQAPPLHPRSFAPSEAELDWARTIVTAFRDARAQGKGIVVVDGRLVEKLHVDEAERLIALNAAIAAAGERAAAA